MKNTLLVTLFLTLILSGKAQNSLKIICELPADLKEISGMAYDTKQDIIWAINDSGNDAVVLGLDQNKQQIVAKAFLDKGINEDWEDLAHGPEGTLFIADTGNNNYKRKSMTVYWVETITKDAKSVVKALKTTIKFPEDYVKKKKIRTDIEALVFIDNTFYLFTKTTKKDGFDGFTEVFAAAAVPGKVHATQVGKINLCDSKDDCKITAADFNYESNTLALLSHKNLWLINDFKDKLEQKTIETIHYTFDRDTQKEGLTFLSPNSLLISEEQTKGPNYLYKFSF